MGSDGEQNKTYQVTIFSRQEIFSNHTSGLSSHGILSSDKDNYIPLLYWILKLHKKSLQRFIAGSSTCSTKPLSKLLTIILSKIKDGLKRYTDTIYSRNGVNQMWILNKFKALMVSKIKFIKSQISLNRKTTNYLKSKVSSIKTFDFS